MNKRLKKKRKKLIFDKVHLVSLGENELLLFTFDQEKVSIEHAQHLANYVNEVLDGKALFMFKNGVDIKKVTIEK